MEVRKQIAPPTEVRNDLFTSCHSGRIGGFRVTACTVVQSVVQQIAKVTGMAKF